MAPQVRRIELSVTRPFALALDRAGAAREGAAAPNGAAATDGTAAPAAAATDSAVANGATERAAPAANGGAAAEGAATDPKYLRGHAALCRFIPGRRHSIPQIPAGWTVFFASTL